MGKDFPDPGMFAYKPSAGDDVPAPTTNYVKVVPSMPASQSERPQLRPVSGD